MSRRFVDKVALVTGAAAGIGRATTLLLAREGASVLAVDLDANGLKETVALAEGRVEPYVADLSDPEVCRAVVEHCVATFSRLDVLGNVAGIAGAWHFTDVTVEQYRRMMGVNLDACFFLSQAAMSHLLESKGTIIAIASTAGLTGQAYTSVYGASKAAVIHLTKCLAMEYIKTGVRINAIAPGGMNTPLVRNFVFPPDHDPELAMRYAPLRALGEAEDIASMFAYLASEEARAIHGAVVSVDNGMTAG